MLLHAGVDVVRPEGGGGGEGGEGEGRQVGGAGREGDGGVYRP